MYRLLPIAALFAALLALAGPDLGAQVQMPYDSTVPGHLTDASLSGTSSGTGLASGQGFGTQYAGPPAWIVIAQPAVARSRPGSATLGGKDFWIIGGETSGGGRAAFVEQWHRGTDTWTQSSVPMPVPVSNIMGSCVHDNGLFYVFGGFDINWQPVDTIQIYDPATDTWSVHQTTLPRPMMGVGASNLGNGQILVCGGSDLAFVYGDAWIFDTTAGTFTTTGAMPQADTYLTITARPNSVDGKVYMTGYYTDTFLVIYDPTTGSFQNGPAFLNHPTNGQSRAGCGMDSVGSKVFAYAGDWFGYRADVESYDVLTGQQRGWPTLDMHQGRRAFAYGALPCPACYASCGWAGQYLAHSEAAR